MNEMNQYSICVFLLFRQDVFSTMTCFSGASAFNSIFFFFCFQSIKSKLKILLYCTCQWQCFSLSQASPPSGHVGLFSLFFFSVSLLFYCNIVRLTLHHLCIEYSWGFTHIPRFGHSLSPGGGGRCWSRISQFYCWRRCSSAPFATDPWHVSHHMSLINQRWWKILLQ